MMTIEYSESARHQIEAYLNAVRDRLRSSPSVDAQEVIDGLRGHIERELSELDSPISASDARSVLERLGSPEQVIDEEDMSWWQKIIVRLRCGPEDWRLAYLSFGVLLAGTWLAGPFGVLASFLVSRAALSVAREPDPPAKKWLVYPSLIIVYVAVVCVGLFGPAYIVGDLIGDVQNTRTSMFYKEPFFGHDGVGTVLAMLASGGLCFAACCSLFWFLGRFRPDFVRILFRPFAENWTGSLLGRLAIGVWGISLVLAATVLLLWGLS